MNLSTKLTKNKNEQEEELYFENQEIQTTKPRKKGDRK